MSTIFDFKYLLLRVNDATQHAPFHKDKTSETGRLQNKAFELHLSR